jgi:hypothetical protein
MTRLTTVLWNRSLEGSLLAVLGPSRRNFSSWLTVRS